MRLPPLDLTLLGIHYLLSAGDAARVRTRPTRSSASACDTSPVLATALSRAACAGLPDVAAPRLSTSATSRPPAAGSPPAGTNGTNGTNGAGVLTVWAPIWDTLPVYQRADLARAVARAQHAGIALTDSLTAVERENGALTQRWLATPVGQSLRPADPAVPPYAQEGRRTDDVDVDRMLRTQADRSLNDTVCAAGRLAQHVHPWPLTAEQETAYQARRLADLFDLERLGDASRSNLDLLRAVHTALRTRFPDYDAPLRDAHAIAVAFALRRRFEARSNDAGPAMQLTDFTRAIDAERATQTRATLLLPGPNPPPRGGAWFDGLAVRNATGMTVSQLAEDLARRKLDLVDAIAQHNGPTQWHAHHPLYGHRVSAANLRSLETMLRERLADLRESARFPFGTPPQSIDTVLLRLSSAHGLPRSDGEDFATVMRDFNQLCATWRASPAYWISPTLAAALHFAHATGDHAGLLALDAEDRENRAIDLFHERLSAYAASRPPDTDARAREPGPPPAHDPAVRRNDTPASPDGNAAPAAMPPETAHARDLIESVLVLPRWAMHMGEMLMRGEPREILGLLPFIVPAYDIEEGIRLGNATRALRGSFQFGADALMTWIGGRVSASLALPPALSPAENGERAMLGMLHRGLETLGDAHAEWLPLTEQGAVRLPGTTTVLPDADLPLRYRPLASRARDGEVVPVTLPNVHHAGLVHLPRENRVIPVGASGHSVWELDWDGHIVGSVSDTRLGAVKQDILRTLRASPVPALDAGTIAESETVTALTRWLDAHARADLPPAGQHVAYDAERVLDSLVYLDETTSQGIALRQEFGQAYCRSGTFRLLTHWASSHASRTLLRIECRPGAMPAYAPERHVITLAPASELAEIEYMGATGQVHFDPKDVWIHEFIHAMTLLTDPPPSLAAANRGPVVYLTDRILYEINRPAPERIAYALPTSRARPRLAPDIRLLTERVVRENLLLDRQLAPKIPMSSHTLVGGTPVARRATVTAARRIESIVFDAMAAHRPRTPFPRSLLHLLHPSTLFHGGRSSAHLRLLRNFVEHAQAIHDGNAWARGFLNAWLERDTTTRWTLHRLSRIMADREGVPCRLDMGARRIELSLADSFTYLSPTGLKPYTMRRRVAALLAELGLPARARTLDAGLDIDIERGAVVYVENKLLGLADNSEDRRIVARVWHAPLSRLPPEIPVNPTLARRIADDEDRFLASVCTRQADTTCICS